jgi:parvulin-like peptidyl-prolyl isomerase
MEAKAAEAKALLVVDEKPLSVRQCLRYLQSAGKLQAFVGDILRQYVLEQALETRQDIEISPTIVEQAVIDFRLQQQLTDSKVFQEWLNRNGLNYEQFHSQIVGSFKLEKLKAQVTHERLQEHFIERKVFFDRVVLSRIVVASKELAEELHSQITEGANFEQLAREYSTADERIANGMMGPIALENVWAIFRVEQFLPATLEDNQLQQAMQNELFEKWLSEKIQTMTVKLQVNE